MNLKTFLTLIFAFLIGTSILFGVAADEAKALKCPGKVNVLVSTVAPTSFVQYNTLNVALVPAKFQSLVSTVPCAIAKIQTAAGAEVKAGDVILELDSKDIKETIAKANLDIKKWQKVLSKKSTKKAAQKEAAENLKNSQELLAQKQAQLKNGIFTATFDGFVEVMNVNEGDHISDGFLMATVVDATQVVAAIPATEADKLNAGQTVSVEIPELGKKLAGTVQKSDQAYLLIDNSGKQIKKGMHAVFSVAVKNHENVLVLSDSQILKDSTGYYIYTVNGKLARKTSITIGPVTHNMVLVSEGIANGDEVVSAEILDPKKGLLKEKITCLEDNKKIVIMEKHATANQYIARKKAAKPAAVVPEIAPPVKAKPVAAKPEVKKEVKKEKKNVYPVAPRKVSKFAIGATINYSKMNTNFDDVYGRLTGFGLDLSYTLTKALDIWLSASYATKKSTLEDFPETPMEFTLLPVSLDLRYFLKRGQKLDIYVGTGFTYYSFEDISPLSEVKSSAIGINLVGGTYYHLSRHLSLHAAFRWSTAKKDIVAEPAPDFKLDLSGIDLLLGVSYGF